MKIQRLERPDNCETINERIAAQFNRLAFFIENMPTQGSNEFNALMAIGYSLVDISKEGRKRKE